MWANDARVVKSTSRPVSASRKACHEACRVDLGQFHIVEPRPPKPCLAEEETAGLDDVDRNVETCAEADDRRRVLGNIRFEQGKAHYLLLTNQWIRWG